MIVSTFLSGIIMATFAASGVFFLKFWCASYDRFYLYFSVACWLLALERICLLLTVQIYPYLSNSNEAKSLIYLVRLAAFVLILVAVWRKNRLAKESHKPPIS